MNTEKMLENLAEAEISILELREHFSDNRSSGVAGQLWDVFRRVDAVHEALEKETAPFKGV